MHLSKRLGSSRIHKPTAADGENLWLVNDHGELVRGRCRSSNACAYCARLFAVETEMLALEGDAPRAWCVLTTRTATVNVTRFYRSREKVQRAIRRRWPAAEFAWFLEFTTGYGQRSGGRRCPHWNLLIKHIDPAEISQLELVVRRVWCGREDAEPAAQFVGAVAEIGGLMRYLAPHCLIRGVPRSAESG